MEKEWYKFKLVDCGKEWWLSMVEKYDISTTPAFVFIKDYKKPTEKVVKTLRWITDDLGIKKYA